MNNSISTHELLEWLDSIPEQSSSGPSSHEEAVRDLEKDPGFRSDCLKDDFVEAVRSAMADEGYSQSKLAKKWGRSRQYLNKVLGVDGRINYSIDTMVSLMLSLDREVKIEYVPLRARRQLRNDESTSRWERYLSDDSSTVSKSCGEFEARDNNVVEFPTFEDAQQQA